MKIKNPYILVGSLITINDWIRWGASYFAESKVGCVSPYNEAYSLIKHCLRLKSIPDKLHNTRLVPDERDKILELFKKRAETKMPVPYIINKSVFAGKAFYVDERVLIPRSPIQLYIQDEFKCLRFENPPKRILDLCTGCGCIGIATALHFPNASVDLADISVLALEVAQINIDKYNLHNRVEVIKSDLFENITGQYDLILCNPPYVNDREMIELKKRLEISEYEPELALKGGIDGLDIVKCILTEASKYLTDQGVLVIEIAQNKGPLLYGFQHINWLAPLKSCPTISVISKGGLTK